MADFSDTRIQIRRGTSAEWQSAGYPILGVGELGYVTDTNELKAGDGTRTFDQLASLGGFSGGLSLDTDPTLSYDLDLNYQEIIGTGNINLSSGSITSASGNLNIDDGDVAVSGNVSVSGNLTLNGTFTNNGSALATVDDTIKKANHLSIGGSSSISTWFPSTTADMLRVTTNNQDTIIHGLDITYNNKRQLTVSNAGPYNIIFKDDSSTALNPASRFYNIPIGEDVVLHSGESIVMTYDDSYSRWQNYTVARATRIIQLTQTEYDALSVIDPNVVYVITGA